MVSAMIAAATRLQITSFCRRPTELPNENWLSDAERPLKKLRMRSERTGNAMQEFSAGKKPETTVTPAVVKLEAEEAEVSVGSDVADAQPFRVVPARETIPTYCSTDVRKLQVASQNVFRIENAGDLKNGDEIEVFWNQDLKWYRGILTQIMHFAPSVCAKTRIRILYHDGDKEDLDDLSKYRWRIIQPLNSYTVENAVSWDVSRENKVVFDDVMKTTDAFQREGLDQLVSSGDVEILANDFASLKPKAWLTDSIVDLFAKRMVSISTHVNDQRFAFLSCRALFKSRGIEKDKFPQILRWLSGIEMQDIDYIIWPLNDNVRKHWLLCVAQTGTRCFMILDPYNVRNGDVIGNNLSCEVSETLNGMFGEYSKKYEDGRKWKEIPSAGLADELNLPIQPAGNTNDCGVLVCLYVWAVVTGLPWRMSGITRAAKTGRNTKGTFDDLMEAARINIGGILGRKI